MTNRNSGTSSGRNADGTFAPGNPGKPHGSRHKATRAVQQLMQGSAEALTQKAVDLALEGDTTALRICIERIAPPTRDAPVNFTLPKMACATDAANAAAAVLQAVSHGNLTPHEGAIVMGLLENYRRTLETSDIEERIARLEKEKA